MREMMKRLNVVKYATSEEQKKDLIGKGFKPVSVKEKKTGRRQEQQSDGSSEDEKAGGGDGDA